MAVEEQEAKISFHTDIHTSWTKDTLNAFSEFWDFKEPYYYFHLPGLPNISKSILGAIDDVEMFIDLCYYNRFNVNGIVWKIPLIVLVVLIVFERIFGFRNNSINETEVGSLHTVS